MVDANPLIPTLNTGRLFMRPFTVADAAPMHEILMGKDVLRYFPGTEPPPLGGVEKMIGGMLKHWDKHGYGLWAVIHLEDGNLLGRCGLQYLPDTDEVEVDFILGRPYWGNGYATEAGQAAVRYGFETLGVETIVGIVHTENLASQRVLEKLGLGNRRRATYFGLDVFRYEISREGKSVSLGQE